MADRNDVTIQETWTGTVHLLRPATAYEGPLYRRACRMLVPPQYSLDEDNVRRDKLSTVTCKNCKRTEYYTLLLEASRE